MSQAFDKMLDRYIRHLTIERGLASNTIEAYSGDLRDFSEHMIELGKTTPLDVSHEDIFAWLKFCNEQNLSKSSQTRKLIAVRGFYKFLRFKELIVEAPTEKVSLPKAGRRLPKLVHDDEAIQLLKACGSNLKDRAIIVLLYGAGLRVSEVVELDCSQISLNAAQLRVVGKGDKERIVPVSDFIVEVLKDYIQDSEVGQGHNDALFPGRGRNKRITRQTIFLRLRRLALAAGLPADISPHKLRHGFATDMVRGGADLRAVQTLLGHAHLKTTEIYTQVDERHIKEVYNKTHPRRNVRNKAINKK